MTSIPIDNRNILNFKNRTIQQRATTRGDSSKIMKGTSPDIQSNSSGNNLGFEFK